MTYIKAVLIFIIPKESLSEEERESWDSHFDDLREEVAEDLPRGVIATLLVNEVDEHGVVVPKCSSSQPKL